MPEPVENPYRKIDNGAHVTEPPLPLAWRQLEAEVNGTTFFGQAGVRDPEHPCDAFDPVKGIDWLGLFITAPGDASATCMSDGHYLCKGCSHLSAERIEYLLDP